MDFQGQEESTTTHTSRLECVSNSDKEIILSGVSFSHKAGTDTAYLSVVSPDLRVPRVSGRDRQLW